jgi:hypothetical protein
VHFDCDGLKCNVALFNSEEAMKRLLKERYFSTVEYTDRYGKTMKELVVFSEIGKKPTIGDFIQAFKESGIDVELYDFINMIFKPSGPDQSPIISIRVVRTMRDF